MRCDITIRVWEISSCFSPCTWIRGSARDIGWDTRSWELPQSDSCSAEFQSHNPPSIVVEVITKRGNRSRSVDSTAGIVVGGVDTRVLEWCARLLALDSH
jgi:hypothetical protein